MRYQGKELTAIEKELYSRAIKESRSYGFSERDWKKIIALQQQMLESHRERSKTEASELKEAEGIMITDGIAHVNEKDTLILQSKIILRDDVAAEWQKNIEERIGIKVIILSGEMGLIGMVRHDA